MYKKILSLLSAAILLNALVVCPAFSLPYPGDNYTWTETDFWTPTDITTNVSGNSIYEIELENAAYESNFGLYNTDDIDSPGSATNTFRIFDKNDEVGKQKSISFWDDSGTWKITNDYTGKTSTTQWQTFDPVFGFYYDVYSGGSTDDSIEYTFYTANNLNTQDAGVEHIKTAYWDSGKVVKIYLEDLLKEDWTGTEPDFTDMTVSGDDLQPVPEPTTMLLFGTGLLGLAAFGRKKYMKIN